MPASDWRDCSGTSATAGTVSGLSGLSGSAGSSGLGSAGAVTGAGTAAAGADGRSGGATGGATGGGVVSTFPAGGCSVGASASQSSEDRVPGTKQLQIGLVTCHFMKIKRTEKKARACFGELSCQDRIVCTNVTSSHSVVQFLVANLYALLPAPVAWRSQHLGVQFY